MPTPIKPKPTAILRYGYLCVNADKGQQPQRVGVLAEHPTRYEIKALKPTTLSGRRRTLQPGETALVPKWTVKNHAPPSTDPRKAAKAAAREAMGHRYWLATVETTDGKRQRLYRAKDRSAARNQADKVSDVSRVVAVDEISEGEYNARANR